MKAYTVVGPTKLQPRWRSALLSAVDSGCGGDRAQRGPVQPPRPRGRVGREAPGEGGDGAGLGAQLDDPAGIVEHRFDLAAMAHDPGVAEQAGNVVRAEAAQGLGVELGEGAGGNSRACAGS